MGVLIAMRYLTNLLLLSVGFLTVYGGQQRRQLAGGNEADTDGGMDRRRFLLSDLDCAQIQSRWRSRQFLIDNQEDILDGGINKRRFRLANIDCELLSNPRWGK